jgi:hypothetical protein
VTSVCVCVFVCVCACVRGCVCVRGGRGMSCVNWWIQLHPFLKLVPYGCGWWSSPRPPPPRPSCSVAAPWARSLLDEEPSPLLLSNVYPFLLLSPWNVLTLCPRSGGGGDADTELFSLRNHSRHQLVVQVSVLLQCVCVCGGGIGVW